MRLGWAKTKYSISYYVKKTVYIDGKNKDLVIKRLGSEKYICEKYGVTDAMAWAKEQVRLMNEAEKEDSAKFNIELCAGTDLVMDEQRRLNGGYLFLQDIYYELGLHKICRAVSGRHLFKYDLNDILLPSYLSTSPSSGTKKNTMGSMLYEGKGYQPVYTKTALTDALHNAFGFCTSKQIVPVAKMKNICSQTKK